MSPQFPDSVSPLQVDPHQHQTAQMFPALVDSTSIEDNHPHQVVPVAPLCLD